MNRLILIVMLFEIARVSAQVFRVHSPNGIPKKVSDTNYGQSLTPGQDLPPEVTTEESINSNYIPNDTDEPEEDTKDCVLTATPPEPDSNCCGIDATVVHRIVGAEGPTPIGQHPWLVQIEYYNRTLDKYEGLCGGFLISGRYVVSAAHCFMGDILKFGSPVNVILGDHDIRNEGPDCDSSEGSIVCTDGAIKVPIEEKISHPDTLIQRRRLDNDIVLVRLSKTVEYTNFIRPICLPTSDVTVSPPNKLRFFAAGWGVQKDTKVRVVGKSSVYFEHQYENDGKKRHVDLPYVNTEECKKIYKFLNERHICAGGEKGKDSCKYDSGGPLIYKKDDVYEVVGIVSTYIDKYECGTEGHPAVYTRMYPYVDWIKKNIKV